MKKEIRFLTLAMLDIMAGDKIIPGVSVVKTIEASANGSSQEIIQSAIDEVSKIAPDKKGFRGTFF